MTVLRTALIRASISTKTIAQPQALNKSRLFHTSPILHRIFNPVRSEDEFNTLLSLSATNSAPLITLWTASWCSTCHSVSPILQNLVEDRDEGGKGAVLGFTEVAIDLPDTRILQERYMITTVPTIIAFHRNQVIFKRLAGAGDVKKRDVLEAWLDEVVKEGRKTQKSGWLW